MAKKERYVVWIHVKPHVKRYLMNNFRVHDKDWKDLVNIAEDNELKTFLNVKLEKPSHRRDGQANMHYTDKVAIEISKDQFYRYGWALSHSDEIMLNKALEIRCKTMALTYLSSVYMVCGSLSLSIRKFYKTFGFSDENWKTDTLRKMWFRERKLPKITVNDAIFEKIDQFILDRLSEYGTITNQGKKLYEENANDNG